MNMYHLELIPGSYNLIFRLIRPSSGFHVTPDDGLISRNIYIKCFNCFRFDTHLVVPLISIIMYHLELKQDLYEYDGILLPTAVSPSSDFTIIVITW